TRRTPELGPERRLLAEKDPPRDTEREGVVEGAQRSQKDRVPVVGVDPKSPDMVLAVREHLQLDGLDVRVPVEPDQELRDLVAMERRRGRRGPKAQGEGERQET